MAFDKEAFRRKAQAKAIRERVQKVRTRVQEEEAVDPQVDEELEQEAMTDSKKLSAEERRVLEQYRQWKSTRESASKPAKKRVTEAKSKSAALREKIAKRIKEEEIIPADGEEKESDPSTANKPGADVQKVGSGKTISQKQLESRKERTERLKRKLEKRTRIAKIKERIAERRDSANDTESSAKIREEATSLKKRISRVRKMIENDMMAQQPMDQGQSQMMDPMGADPMGMEQPAAQLPPEVVTEIQNISAAAQSLASLAGIEPQTDLGAAEGIPAEMGPGAEGMEDPMTQQPVLESRKAKIKEAIAKRKATNDTDTIVENTRTRVAERREALKKLRAQALKEDYKGEGSEEITGQIDAEVEKSMGQNHNDPKEVVHQQGRKIDGPSPSMPGSKKLKPAKTWPTKPAKSQKFESEEVDPEKEELEEQSWDEQHIDHYIERKELNFRDMISKGMLG